MKIKKSLVMMSVMLLGMLLTGCACQGIKDPVIRKANGTFLPKSYPVYVNGNTVVNSPAPGYTAKQLPVDNFYRYVPGCYIACYSKNNGIYSTGQGIYVNGLVRINGLYVGRTCQAQGYFFKDISSISYFSNLCHKRIATCKNNNCWAGGDTGGWFGIR